MKSSVTFTAVLLCTAAFARADVEVTMAELQRIGFLPHDKAELKPEDKLDMKRRNPFAERKKVVAAKPTEQVENEESKLRTYFDKQKVSGVMKLGDKHIVTVGRLALEAGQTLPPIIPGQTQILRVMRVDDKVLEIGWVEEAGYDTAAPRKILKKIDLKPVVSQLLASEDNTGENAQMYLTDDKGKAVLPPSSVFPNPSAIVENLPPGSDTNPNAVLDNSALTESEKAELTALDGSQTPPPPPVPDVAPPPGAPSEDPEDSVQPDPGLVSPPADGRPTPAGPSKK
jgi:hypothetical protein